MLTEDQYIELRGIRNQLRDSIENKSFLEYSRGVKQIKEWDVFLSEYEKKNK